MAFDSMIGQRQSCIILETDQKQKLVLEAKARLGGLLLMLSLFKVGLWMCRDMFLISSHCPINFVVKNTFNANV